VRDSAYHHALAAYGPSAVFVCNASLDHIELLDDLRDLAGREATLLANDPSSFVPLWGADEGFWGDYRAAMDPANAGLPDSAWYWLDERGHRRLAPRICFSGGWCGQYWPGWLLKPDTSAYRAKAEFLASRLGQFDGLWLDEWREGFANYQALGLEIPLDRVPKLTERWRSVRKFYFDVLRESAPSGFLLVPNLQPARNARYSKTEISGFDGHTTEYPDVLDLGRFGTSPSPWNVGWGGWQDVPGIVRAGYGLPANVDP
jgi:hypothetical protein